MTAAAEIAAEIAAEALKPFASVALGYPSPQFSDDYLVFGKIGHGLPLKLFRRTAEALTALSAEQSREPKKGGDPDRPSRASARDRGQDNTTPALGSGPERASVPPDQERLANRLEELSEFEWLYDGARAAMSEAAAFIRQPVAAESEEMARRLVNLTSPSFGSSTGERRLLGDAAAMLRRLSHPATGAWRQAARGWAVVAGDGIDVKTISPTRRAAIINWLVVRHLEHIAAGDTEKYIENLWRQHNHGVDVSEVAIALPASEETPR